MSKGDHLNLDFRPALANFVRLQHDNARDRWVLQAPERVLVLDDTGKAVVDRFDGKASLGEIIDALVAEYDAPRDVIDHDVRAVIGLLEEKRFLRSGADDGE
ncbi:MAG TPA: pyrroloquinoline quinone biosynthesis peptide chaperone PqqD [Gammaproteobacteria bacterium]|nr:pyrroloquinoline quinone biosynthesis peptide chaperone PqqD [Gammaproteobacteria bacterium]